MRARSGPAKSSLTIRDIARLAGVSAATVSRVVNADARVSTAKRGAVMAVFVRGLRVPRDVSIVGFDDRPQSAFTTPALTAVRQPEIEMGAAAVAALLRELRDDASPLPTFATQLIVRESTAGPPASHRRARPSRS